MIALAPATLISNRNVPESGRWFRLARASDGRLCLESSTDCFKTVGATGNWTFCAEVPPYIAKQLSADDNRDQVAKVLDRALHVLRYK